MRQLQKEQTREVILATAAHCFRKQGYSATGVSELMKRSKLTNGAFYVHFKSKEDLLLQSACSAAKQLRESWVQGLDTCTPLEKIDAMLARYMSHYHRDHPETGCTLPTLGAEISRSNPATRKAVGHELQLSQQVLADVLAELGCREATGLAWSLLSLCVGSISLARIATPPESDDIIHSTLAQAKQLVRHQLTTSK